MPFYIPSVRTFCMNETNRESNGCNNHNTKNNQKNAEQRGVTLHIDTAKDS